MGQRRPFWGRRVAAAAPGPGGPFTDPAAYVPHIDDVRGNDEGEFPTKPIGFLLHGTRSGAPQNDVDQEYAGTLNYVRSGASGLGWQATIGNDQVGVHQPWTHWAWHAYDASRILIGLEFAQPTVDSAVTDGQIRAAAWCLARAREAVLERWGTPIPIAFWTHAEVEANGWTHHSPEGKTDTFPMSDPRALDLKTRLLARLRAMGITT